ncbi:unnamed protein product [Linum trigynum]|uniref:Uncharacterized protein n=1 Tax=Linum trigynum TaxID=586398 RepID=A0AAV2DZG3_9ROSI
MSQSDSGATNTTIEKGGNAELDVIKVLEGHLSPDSLRDHKPRVPRSKKEAPRKATSGPSPSELTKTEAPTTTKASKAPAVAKASKTPETSAQAPCTTNQSNFPCPFLL